MIAFLFSNASECFQTRLFFENSGDFPKKYTAVVYPNFRNFTSGFRALLMAVIRSRQTDGQAGRTVAFELASRFVLIRALNEFSSRHCVWGAHTHTSAVCILCGREGYRLCLTDKVYNLR